jgi:hypothetical protein
MGLEIKRLHDVDGWSCMHSMFQTGALGVRCLDRVGGAEGSEESVVGGNLRSGDALAQGVIEVPSHVLNCARCYRHLHREKGESNSRCATGSTVSSNLPVGVRWHRVVG